MKQLLFKDKFPIYKLELARQESSLLTAQEIINYLKIKIDTHPEARFIAEFDHYSHTSGMPDGEIDSNIIDARNIVFCFGVKLPNPDVLAVRPRSIGVAETHDGFSISFLEAPMAEANTTMKQWVLGLQKQAA